MDAEILRCAQDDRQDASQARSREVFSPNICPGPKTNMKSSIDLIKGMFYNLRMDMFVALADPTRRHILELLATSGELSATAIYEHFSVSPQAVSQHLKVLREAHLVEMEKRAQKHVYRLNPQTLSQFEAWVQQVQQRWEERDRKSTRLNSSHGYISYAVFCL